MSPSTDESPGSSADETPDSSVGRPTDEPSTGLDHVEDALREVRREGRKVAALYAAVDAALVLLATNLVVAHLGPGILPEELRLPATLVGPVADALGRSVGPVEVPASAVLAVVVGVAAFTVEYVVRVRRPLVEQFEAANPDLRVALRTARDAASNGAETRMALRLYEDVLDRLRGASSARLLDGTRVAVTMVAVVGLCLLTIQTAAVDFDLVGLDGSGPSGADGPDQSRAYEGLQDADGVLGDAEDVDAGDEELAAQVASSGGDRDPDADRVGGYDSVDHAGSGDFESQQSGYAPAEEIEDAALIREYNLQIRDDEG